MRALALTSCLLLAACAAPAARAPDVLLLGEQHDAPRHQELHRETVQALAGRGQLAALALEMVEEGTSTAGLPPSAGEDAVREALRWNDAAWPWSAYGPVAMAAVRAGVPVLGANLPRAQMRAAMEDARIDATLDAAALAAQREAIDRGHCGLLPASRLPGMVRVQVARDRAMARTLAAAARPGRTVVLVAGAGHVDAQLGVPRHLPAGLVVEPRVWPAQPSGVDHCAQLREQMAPRRAP